MVVRVPPHLLFVCLALLGVLVVGGVYLLLGPSNLPTTPVTNVSRPSPTTSTPAAQKVVIESNSSSAPQRETSEVRLTGRITNYYNNMPADGTCVITVNRKYAIVIDFYADFPTQIPRGTVSGISCAGVFGTSTIFNGKKVEVFGLLTGGEPPYVGISIEGKKEYFVKVY